MGRAEIDRRLKRVEGQIRGLQRMVEQERECEAVLTQLMAARAALDRVALMVVDNHLKECMDSSDPERAQQRMKRVLEMVFSRYSVSEPREEPLPGAAELPDKEE
ncbi:MAG TPA: metal-sensitive transcriptional regulator [Anaerolineae bacterium]|nr:metal-sensitive transcriptional regulator [Anaerolineae bacterium]